jgi:FtsP/CotA-like multicopper oxidase with cupredoxin domain
LEYYIDGLIGGFITHPRNERLVYDDQTVLLAQDFYHINPGTLTTEYFLTPLSGGAEPIPTSILVNGEASLDFVRDRTGKSLLVLVGANAFSVFKVSFLGDEYPFYVTQLDGVDVEPYLVKTFLLNVGQRVNILVDWSLVPAGTTHTYETHPLYTTHY